MSQSWWVGSFALKDGNALDGTSNFLETWSGCYDCVVYPIEISGRKEVVTIDRAPMLRYCGK